MRWRDKPQTADVLDLTPELQDDIERAVEAAMPVPVSLVKAPKIIVEPEPDPEPVFRCKITGTKEGWTLRITGENILSYLDYPEVEYRRYLYDYSGKAKLPVQEMIPVDLDTMGKTSLNLVDGDLYMFRRTGHRIRVHEGTVSNIANDFLNEYIRDYKRCTSEPTIIEKKLSEHRS